jgi:hypothetical protein
MTSKLRSYAAAAGFAISLAFTVPANASTIPLGTLSEGSPVLVSGVIASPTNASDTVTFSLAGVDSLGASLTAIPTISVGAFEFGLSSLSASLYTDGGTLIGNLSDGSAATFTSLAAGDYYITLTGTAVSPVLGGAYGLSLLADSAAPVPGPAALLPALAGAGAIAWRRRRSKKNGKTGAKLMPA